MAQAVGCASSGRSGRVLGGDTPCLATLYAPGWAVTTAACGAAADWLRTDDGAVFEVRRTATDGRVTAIGAPGASASTYPPLGAWDFESAWAQQRAHAELVGLENGVAVTVPLVRPPPEAPNRPDGMMAVSPGSGCPLVDGAPLFADDPDDQGSIFWTGVPMVGMVNAAASSCSTFAAIPVASFAPLLIDSAVSVRRRLLQRGEIDPANETATLYESSAPEAAPANETLTLYGGAPEAAASSGATLRGHTVQPKASATVSMRSKEEEVFVHHAAHQRRLRHAGG